ncbi:hypothetical protein THASP1DRAFT_33853, partial [Thamnocephalis sphaerospora]
MSRRNQSASSMSLPSSPQHMARSETSSSGMGVRAEPQLVRGSSVLDNVSSRIQGISSFVVRRVHSTVSQRAASPSLTVGSFPQPHHFGQGYGYGYAGNHGQLHPPSPHQGTGLGRSSSSGSGMGVGSSGGGYRPADGRHAGKLGAPVATNGHHGHGGGPASGHSPYPYGHPYQYAHTHPRADGRAYGMPLNGGEADYSHSYVEGPPR